MDNTGKEKEAMQLMAEADKKVKASGSFLGGMFGGNHKVEDACEMYARAANMFKMAKNWSAAGNAFCQAARLHMQLQNKLDSATSFVDAGNAYKKADPQEAINCLNQAIDIYTDMGRFTIAAKHHITIAEVYESELVDIEKAIAHYEQAADYYKGEESNRKPIKRKLDSDLKTLQFDSTEDGDHVLVWSGPRRPPDTWTDTESSANKCLLKVGHYSAQLDQYQKAIEIYEQKLLEAHEEQNSEAFTEAVKEFDSVSRLDQWLTTMLLRIKKTIQGDAGDLK
ncbi:Beta-soluble NSF attachment protein [Collichthys lucidus]|uniref:Beta-soluble NSF attachment protein n=1 Tax=Collichthys lucidus TaxID=240159 RepID=A0A4U5VD73_COLLU|nr:Beta-soluble NSF attachment protein [Collichthys lucidus]